MNLIMFKKSINRSFKFFIYPLLLLGILNQFFSVQYRINASTDKLNYEEYVKSKKYFNDYILGPGDVLNLFVVEGADDINNQYVIDRNGFIYLPRLEQLYVKGLTIQELSKVLNNEYLKYINFPDIKITIYKYKPLTVFVNGEVNYPGKYTFEGQIKDQSKNITLFDALQKAGGITDYSDLKNIKIVRKETIFNGGGKKQASLNLLKVFLENDASQNIALRNGDSIYVRRNDTPSISQLGNAMRSNINPKFIDVIVSGRVDNPGKKEIFASSSLNDAIDVAGGVKFLKGKVTYISRDSSGLLERRKFRYSRRHKMGSYKNPILKSGDIIYIGNSPINIANEVLAEFGGPIFGYYAIKNAFD